MITDKTWTNKPLHKIEKKAHPLYQFILSPTTNPLFLPIHCDKEYESICQSFITKIEPDNELRFKWWPRKIGKWVVWRRKYLCIPQWFKNEHVRTRATNLNYYIKLQKKDVNRAHKSKREQQTEKPWLLGIKEIIWGQMGLKTWIDYRILRRM